MGRIKKNAKALIERANKLQLSIVDLGICVRIQPIRK